MVVFAHSRILWTVDGRRFALGFGIIKENKMKINATKVTQLRTMS